MNVINKIICGALFAAISFCTIPVAFGYDYYSDQNYSYYNNNYTNNNYRNNRYRDDNDHYNFSNPYNSQGSRGGYNDRWDRNWDEAMGSYQED